MTFKRQLLRWLYRELDTRSLDKEGAQVFTDVIAYAETLGDEAGGDDVIDLDGHRARRLGQRKQAQRQVSRITDPALYCQVCRGRNRLSSLETVDDGSQVCLRCDWRSGEPVE